MLSEATINERFDELLGAVNMGFTHMEERFQGMERRFHGMEERFQGLEGRFQDVLESNRRIENIVDKWPPPSTINDLLVRTTTIERKLGIKPGEALQ
jgi:hypothetical protein